MRGHRSACYLDCGSRQVPPVHALTIARLAVILVLAASFGSPAHLTGRDVVLRPVASEPEYAALLVGINYEASRFLPSLRYCRKDVADVRVALERLGYTWFVQMTDDRGSDPRATGANIRQQLKEIVLRTKRRKDPLQAFVFYFSGHGLSDSQGNNFLCPPEYDEDILPVDPPDRGLKSLLMKVNARLRVMILDACRNLPRAKSITLVRETWEATAFKGVESDPQNGLVVFYATDPFNTTPELPDIPNGLFTYCLLRALRGECADGPAGLAVPDPAGSFKADAVFACLSQHAQRLWGKALPRIEFRDVADPTRLVMGRTLPTPRESPPTPRPTPDPHVRAPVGPVRFTVGPQERVRGVIDEWWAAQTRRDDLPGFMAFFDDTVTYGRLILARADLESLLADSFRRYDKRHIRRVGETVRVEGREASYRALVTWEYGPRGSERWQADRERYLVQLRETSGGWLVTQIRTGPLATDDPSSPASVSEGGSIWVTGPVPPKAVGSVSLVITVGDVVERHVPIEGATIDWRAGGIAEGTYDVGLAVPDGDDVASWEDVEVHRGEVTTLAIPPPPGPSGSGTLVIELGYRGRSRLGPTFRVDLDGRSLGEGRLVRNEGRDEGFYQDYRFESGDVSPGGHSVVVKVCEDDDATRCAAKAFPRVMIGAGRTTRIVHRWESPGNAVDDRYGDIAAFGRPCDCDGKVWEPGGLDGSPQR